MSDGGTCEGRAHTWRSRLGHFIRHLFTCAEIVLALEIPRSITIGLYSDSVLAMREQKGRGSSVHLLSNMHLHVYVNQQSIMDGAACRSILRKLPDADLAKEDCTLVFCMLNEVSGDKITQLSETSSVGQDIIS